MMNILLTGSNGYIGNEFIATFQHKYNISTFSSLTDKLEELVLKNIDTVVHLAALVHQKKNLSYEDYHKVNVDYPLLLAKKAKESGVKHFVFMSSIAVYGDDKVLLNEHTSCNPHTFYGRSKLEAEKKLIELENDDFCVSIIRPPMIYGKNAPGNIASLINLIKISKILPFADIHNKRTFIYIGNLLALMMQVIDLRQNGIFLASDDAPLSTTTFIKLIAKELEKKVLLVKIPLFALLLKTVKPSFYKKLYGNLEVNNSITQKRLNIKNPYSTEEGVQLMLHEKHSTTNKKGFN